MHDWIRHCRAARIGRLALLAAILVAPAALSGCVGASSKDLQALGASAVPANVDFSELSAYAGRAKTAYADEAAIRLAYPTTIRVNTPGATNTQYFVERDDKTRTQYISVRGTANKKNISEDIAIKVREDSRIDIPVHSGFDDTAQALYGDLKPFLKPGYKTYVTGHSLGGAIAVLLAIYLIEDGYDVVRVVTFGQPKFTTSDGASRLGFLPLTRVVDENDMVPMLPPVTTHDKTHGTYEHVGPELILLEGPNYVFLPDHDAERLSIDEFWRSISLASLADHHMDKYLGRLSTKAKGATPVPYNKREHYVARKKPAKAQTGS